MLLEQHPCSILGLIEEKILFKYLLQIQESLVFCKEVGLRSNQIISKQNPDIKSDMTSKNCCMNGKDLDY